MTVTDSLNVPGTVELSTLTTPPEVIVIPEYVGVIPNRRVPVPLVAVNARVLVYRPVVVVMESVPPPMDIAAFTLIATLVSAYAPLMSVARNVTV